MEYDEVLREEIIQISALKRHVKDAYQNLNVPAFKPIEQAQKTGWQLPKTAVATLFIGILVGFFAVNMPFNQAFVSSPGQAQLAENKYLIHLDSADQPKLAAALQKTEQLLEQGGPGVQVDFITNSEGVNLFDVNNPNRAKLEALLSRFDNLTLFACKRALQRVMDKNVNFRVLPQVKHDKPAVDAVVERINSGWKYIKI
jgi:intracellular sulfur oxidation DsrE/DsrF family protein